MDQPLAGITIAFMVANGFEETEMTEPQRALLKVGATVRTISPEQGLVNGWHGQGWGHFFPVDKQVNAVLGADFDMLVLPGGERSTVKLTANPHVRRIVGHFLDAGKPIGAINDGVGVLAIAPKLKGRKLAAPEALVEALKAAGATCTDQQVTVDGSLITASTMDALAGFTDEVVKVFCAGAQMRKAA
ncbi:MAG: peptidase C56 [Azospirillum sp.]|nr:peptidase C56 [Azospirillum sp.]